MRCQRERFRVWYVHVLEVGGLEAYWDVMRTALDDGNDGHAAPETDHRPGLGFMVVFPSGVTKYCPPR